MSLEKRVQRLEKMWENVKNGKPFWIPYEEPSESSAKEPEKPEKPTK